jgi:hypothetical protein
MTLEKTNICLISSDTKVMYVNSLTGKDATMTKGNENGW